MRDLFACILGFHPSIHAESKDCEAKVNDIYEKELQIDKGSSFCDGE